MTTFPCPFLWPTSAQGVLEIRQPWIRASEAAMWGSTGNRERERESKKREREREREIEGGRGDTGPGPVTPLNGVSNIPFPSHFLLLLIPLCETHSRVSMCEIEEFLRHTVWPRPAPAASRGPAQCCAAPGWLSKTVAGRIIS